MSRILLVSPKFDSEYSRAHGIPGGQKSKPFALMVPLHLATVAALTPDDFEVDIYDESVRDEITKDTDFGKEYDLVGVTGYIAHIPREKELAAIFRNRGVPTVVGGPGVSGAAEACRGHFDVMLLGEAELTWPRFLREWKKGTHLSEYRQLDRPDLGDSPVPRWESVRPYIRRYAMGGVQTTRGCPFDCEFCDVIHLFGRKPRHRPIERVIEDVVTMEALGMRLVFVCDDDFSGHPQYAKDLLRALIPVNNSFDQPIAFTTQLTIDVAKDDELLELMADCNFGQVLVGIESPREASLRETNKLQNLRGDMIEDVKHIQSYGIAVRASLVVGFDSDDVDVIDEHVHFIYRANIVATNINTLKAYPGTPLWMRLQQQDRVIDVDHIYSDAPRVVCNIIPKGMSRIELLEGYRRLLEEVRSWEGFRRRLRGFVAGVARRPRVKPPTRRRQLQMLGRGLLFALKSFLTGGEMVAPIRRQVIAIIRETLKTAPHMTGQVIGLTAQHVMDVLVLPYHSKVIQQQIDEARAGELRIDKDPSAGMIPKEFYKKLGKVMPLLYGRLSGEIAYQPAIPEAMADVLKDFVIRWGASFEDFELHHRTYLNELCDRHIERWNARARSAPVESGEKPLTAEHAKKIPFIKGLLVSVERDLRGDVRSKTGAAYHVPLTAIERS